jgi:hypothetical protein
MVAAPRRRIANSSTTQINANRGAIFRETLSGCVSGRIESRRPDPITKLNRSPAIDSIFALDQEIFVGHDWPCRLLCQSRMCNSLFGSYRPCAEHGSLLCPFHRTDAVRRKLFSPRMGEDWKAWPASDRALSRRRQCADRAQRLVGAQSPARLQNAASGRLYLALVPQTDADSAGLSSERSDRPLHLF